MTCEVMAYVVDFKDMKRNGNCSYNSYEHMSDYKKAILIVNLSHIVGEVVMIDWSVLTSVPDTWAAKSYLGDINVSCLRQWDCLEVWNVL